MNQDSISAAHGSRGPEHGVSRGRPAGAADRPAGQSYGASRVEFSRRLVFLLLRTALPAVLTVSLVVIVLYLVAIPTLDNSLMGARRDTIRELTDTVWHLLASYQERVASGELTIEDAQARAIARVRTLRYGPDGLDYFWINDVHPRMVMHPFRTDLEGKDLSDFEDPTGMQLFVEFTELVSRQGAGYVEYFWQRPDDAGQVEPKLSYVRAFEPWGWIVGTGDYINDVNLTIAAVSTRLNLVFGVIVALVVLLSAHLTIRGLRTEAARQQADRQRRESEEMFRALAESSLDTIMRFDREGRHLYVNPAVEVQLGLAPAEIIGKTHADLGLPDERAAFLREAINTVFDTAREHRVEVQLRSGAWIDWLLCPEFAASGDVRAVIASARDITARKASEERRQILEARLASAGKMEAIGRLAGGIAHDFNNILTVIAGFADSLFASLPADDPRRREVNEIRASAERASRLVNQLLAFAGRQLIEPTVLDLGRILHRSQAMLARLIGEDVELNVQVADDVWPVRADRGQVEQILVNLVVNARDAMPHGGRMVLQVRNLQVAGAAPCRHCAKTPDGDYVALEVSDTGGGMSDEILERVFEPFFTTKGKHEGTGLGLAVVLGAVQQNDAHVDVRSKPGAGSTFTVYFPRVAGVPEDGERPQVPEEIEAGAGTILLVEDEKLVCELATRILRELGYNVLAAHSGAEALALAGAHNAEIHLLLSDVVMPMMNGYELWTSLRDLHPGLRVLFLSGYPQEVIAQRGVGDDTVPLLRKPFTKQELAAKVREALNRRQASGH